MRKDVHIHRLRRLFLVFFISFLAVALTIAWWGVARSNLLEVREDNPRRVEAELRIQRGEILDTNGVLLAESVTAAGQLERYYPLTYTAPAVGYYSFRYGTVGVEDGFDTVLRGDANNAFMNAWRGLLHEPQVGRDVRLTLDATLQAQASQLLGEHQGAVILLTVPEGAIRILLSHPLYDPNELDEMFEQLVEDESAPLLNRATQGQYQPGMVLAPFVLAMAAEQEVIDWEDPVTEANRPVLAGGQMTSCLFNAADVVDWTGVLSASCPAPLVDLAPRLGEQRLQTVWNSFGFTAVPTITAVPLTDEASTAAIITPTTAIIGQENLTVSPLQVAIAWSALASNGAPVQARLVAAVQNEMGEWGAITTNPASSAPMVTEVTAAQLRSMLPATERALEYTTLVLSGPEGSTNGWYLGMAPATTPRYAIVVVVENVAEAAVAQSIGRELLRTVLSK